MFFSVLSLFNLVLLSCFYVECIVDRPCIPRQYEHSSFVCVCNATYCDDISPIVNQGLNSYVCYTSTMDGMRFSRSTGTMQPYSTTFPPLATSVKCILEIDRETTYQTIHGFGGAFTDAACINIMKLPNDAQDNLIKSYFSSSGIEFNMGRVPIGGSDFSEQPYAYNSYPEDDVYLKNFSLSTEDYKYKIPVIQKSAALTANEIYLTGSVWSPPVWMKSNKRWGGPSCLLDKYYQTYADYHVKFLEAYNKEGLNFWAITTGNEPMTVFLPYDINTLGWWAVDQGRWVANNLRPALKNSSLPYVKILAMDDQRLYIPYWISLMSLATGALSSFDGIAVHWYFDFFVGPYILDWTRSLYPNKFLIYTESSAGFVDIKRIKLGSWSRGEAIFQSVLENLNHWVTGWIDWNLAVDRNGGPNWYKNFIDAPIIVLGESGEFLKQPVFYAFGHFSKFINRGSKRVKMDKVMGSVPSVAFLRPDGGIAVVFYNPCIWPVSVIIREKYKGAIKIEVPSKSFNSLVYW